MEPPTDSTKTKTFKFTSSTITPPRVKIVEVTPEEMIKIQEISEPDIRFRSEWKQITKPNVKKYIAEENKEKKRKR